MRRVMSAHEKWVQLPDLRESISADRAAHNPGWDHYRLKVIRGTWPAQGHSVTEKSMATHNKAELLQNLRVMLRDMLRLRTQGGAYAKLARAHGYVDGYMRVLLETGAVEQRELLALVAEERCVADGPSTTELRQDDTSEPGDANVIAA